MHISQLLARQREFFNTGKTRESEFRQGALSKLASCIEKAEPEILAALQRDLGKAHFEAWSTEIGVVLGDIRYMKKHLHRLIKPRRVPTPLALIGGSSRIIPEPLGVVLVLAPWNYPFHLLMRPLVGAIAAGNCVILKPSEQAPASSAASYELIKNTFPAEYVALIEGGPEIASRLCQEDFDCIFFTGSPREGKKVMEAAARNLTPVILELGGKSPCIVDRHVDLELSARRIAWGKFLNAGQTCVAPDYILADKVIKAALLRELGRSITEFYGNEPLNSPDYSRIINEKHFDRLIELLDSGSIVCGGESKRESLYIAPTVIEGVSWQDPIMQDEIFGPLLPVMEYENLDQAIEMINSRSKPLALYVFSRDKRVVDRIIRQTSSGGVAVNDTISHILPNKLPFGGVGHSGMGVYHGDESFNCFSHRKSLFQNTTSFDLKVKYPPYRMPLEKLKRFMSLM